VYLIRVRGKALSCLTREGKCDTIRIDPTEYRFKVALAKKDDKEMVRIIKTSNLVGQSIIGYLQKKGYPEVTSSVIFANSDCIAICSGASN
jgi:coatomer protein complex subunit alpha (xenin)